MQHEAQDLEMSRQHGPKYLSKTRPTFRPLSGSCSTPAGPGIRICGDQAPNVPAADEGGERPALALN